MPGIEDKDANELLSLVNKANTPSGSLSDRHLRYLHEKKMPENTVRYAFADILAEQNSLYWQIIHSAAIGTGAFSAFFLFAIILSKWAVRPVEEAWERQHPFVADASHELKTPLTVILSNANMMS